MTRFKDRLGKMISDRAATRAAIKYEQEAVVRNLLPLVAEAIPRAGIRFSEGLAIPLRRHVENPAVRTGNAVETIAASLVHALGHAAGGFLYDTTHVLRGDGLPDVHSGDELYK